MKLNHVLLVGLMAVSANALAQGKTTIITTVNGEVTHVTQVDNPPPARAFNTFEETDTDRNGHIDQEEAHNAGILVFSAADLDNNGWLDNSEYEAVAMGTTTLPAPE